MGTLNFKSWNEDIVKIGSVAHFEDLALQAFHYQSACSSIYANYLHALKIVPASINYFREIPFLPIEFFKTHEVKAGDFKEERVFISSGTTSTTASRHFIKSLYTY